MRSPLLTLAVLATCTTAASAQNEGIGAAGAVAARGPINLPTLGVVVPVPDQTLWSAEPRDIGNGHWADFLTGSRDGATFTFMVAPAGPSLDCATLMRNASQNTGARVVSNALYAPAYSATPVVETAGGVGLFCQDVNGRPAVFSVSPAGMSSSQQLSMRALVTAIGAAGTALALPPHSSEYGLTEGMRLVRLGLVVPIVGGWSAGTFVGNNGGDPIDQVTRAGDAGRISIALSRLTGMDCATSLQSFVSSQTSFVTSPDWLASNWYSQVVITSNGSFACLPLAGGALVTSISTVSTANDRTQVRALLVGLRLAAYNTWGAP